MNTAMLDMDEKYMKMALDLAEKGTGYTSPNPMVGAVIVKEGRVVGKGWHERAGGPHAEVAAIRDAGDLAKGATLYVTLEPCNHFGHTPPCTKAILEAGIKRVVYAAGDPNPDVQGAGGKFLAQQGVEVTGGVLRNEAIRQNAVFFKYITTKIPFVTLKCAATLDGKIATMTGDSRWVTGEAAREHVHWMRHASDAILVGIRTVLADDPMLTTRIPGKKGKDPARIILDTRLCIPSEAKVLNLDSDADTLIVCGRGVADPSGAESLEKKGAKVIFAPVKENMIDMVELMGILGKMRITSVLIEGGSRVAGSALRAGITDRVCIFFAPKLLAGDGIPVTSGPGPSSMADALELAGVAVKRFGPDILVEGFTGNPGWLGQS